MATLYMLKVLSSVNLWETLTGLWVDSVNTWRFCSVMLLFSSQDSKKLYSHAKQISLSLVSQIDPKVAFPRRAQPKVSAKSPFRLTSHTSLLIKDTATQVLFWNLVSFLKHHRCLLDVTALLNCRQRICKAYCLKSVCPIHFF